MTPCNLLLRNSQSSGDVMMLTAAVRDLHAQHPGKFRTAVATSAEAIWENNPWVTPEGELVGGGAEMREVCDGGVAASVPGMGLN